MLQLPVHRTALRCPACSGCPAACSSSSRIPLPARKHSSSCLAGPARRCAGPQRTALFRPGRAQDPKERSSFGQEVKRELRTAKDPKVWDPKVWDPKVWGPEVWGPNVLGPEPPRRSAAGAEAPPPPARDVSQSAGPSRAPTPVSQCTAACADLQPPRECVDQVPNVARRGPLYSPGGREGSRALLSSFSF